MQNANKVQNVNTRTIYNMCCKVNMEINSTWIYAIEIPKPYMQQDSNDVLLIRSRNTINLLSSQAATSIHGGDRQ